MSPPLQSPSPLSPFDSLALLPNMREGGKGKRVVVGLSGGVDSAVSALLLKRAGYQVLGIFMKNWEDDDTEEYCSSRVDLVDSAAVADVLGIDFEVVNFSAEYRERVFADFLREYQAGRTPNPDVLCNAEIKFRSFLDHAINLGADWIATGHYAGIAQQDGQFYLLRAVDRNKDQSYFLHHLSQEQLSRTIFPLANLTKPEVRKIAVEAGLPNHARKDSTGICFIGERPFRVFLQRYLPTRPGPILSEKGDVLGEHQGLMFYTIGQRKGIGLGGKANTNGEPWFVARKNISDNALVVVQGHTHPWLYSQDLSTKHCHWINRVDAWYSANIQMEAQTRYRQSPAVCHPLLDLNTLSDCSFHFPQAQWAATPGQSAVLYDGQVCLGGGIITGAASTC